MSLSHDELMRSLAGHLSGERRMVWCDMQLGPAGSPRPDVYSIFKSFSNPSPLAYECKVSHADFRGDVTSGKWQSYLPFCCGVYFAVEGALVAKSEVPEHCGLMVFANGRWRAAKKATLRPCNIPQDACLKLLIDGVEREGPKQRAKVWYDEHVYIDRLQRKFGSVAARTIRDRLAVEHEIQDCKRSVDRIMEHARQQADATRKESEEHIEPLRLELCEVLGLKPAASRWDIQRAVANLRQSMQEHPAQESWRRFSEVVSRALDHHGFKKTVTDSSEEVA